MSAPDRSRAATPEERADLGRRLRLMVLTRPRPACGRPLAEVVAECVDAGATAVQLRNKQAGGGDLYRTGRALLPPVRDRGALFLVDDRPDVAMALGADGVHLGPRDAPVGAIRRIAPEGFLIGYSTDVPEEAVAAARAGADYLGVGAVYGTRSKPDAADEAIGPERVGEVLAAAALPGVGIGGITPENASAVARTGAGIAVLGAVMGAADPGAAVRRLREAIDGAR